MPLMLQIGRIFKRAPQMLPLEREVGRGEIARVSAKRTSFFRPWAKRDAAINSLREGMESLAGTIVSNLIAQLVNIELICAGGLLIGLIGQWRLTDISEQNWLLPLDPLSGVPT